VRNYRAAKIIDTIEIILIGIALRGMFAILCYGATQR
jgi:hypothetical protein